MANNDPIVAAYRCCCNSITGNATVEANVDYRGLDSHEDAVIDGRNDDGLVDMVVADNKVGVGGDRLGVSGMRVAKTSEERAHCRS